MAKRGRRSLTVTVSAFGLVVWMVLAGAGCGCEGASSGGADASVDAADARQEASVAQDAGRDGGADARPDATWPPVGVSYDFCDEPFFKLPIDSETQKTPRVHLWGSGLLYPKTDAGDSESHRLFYFDLEQCKEYRIAGNEEQGGGNIWESLIVYSLCDGCSNDPFRGTDLEMIDVEDWHRERLTDDHPGRISPIHNGQQILFLRIDDYNPPNAPVTPLGMLDTVSGEEIELEPSGGYYAISERHAVWRSHMGGGSHVAYMDLQTEEIVHIESTWPWNQMGLDTWGNYIVWVASENYVDPPFHARLYHVRSGQETVLTEDEETLCYATIHENLVAWTTTHYRDPSIEGIRPADIELYDIKTGLHRRLTSQPSRMRQSRVFQPYLLIIDVGEQKSMHDWYVANLEKLGVIDAQGNLLDGPPVIDPP